MTVEYADAEPNGLAEMIGGLIRANLERHPRRAALLKPAVIDLTAPDAGVSVSIAIAPERIRVANGPAEDDRHVHVQADSRSLLQLSSVPLRFGLPDPFDPTGRAVYRKLASGQIRIDGLLLHPGKLARLSKLLSVV